MKDRSRLNDDVGLNVRGGLLSTLCRGAMDDGVVEDRRPCPDLDARDVPSEDGTVPDRGTLIEGDVSDDGSAGRNKDVVTELGLHVVERHQSSVS